jgi:hypothetical protein
MKISVSWGVTRCSLVEHCRSKRRHILEDSSNILFSFMGWGKTVHSVHRPLIGLFYQPRMIDDDDDCGAIGGMRIGRGNPSTRRKSAPVPLCLPQIPHDLTGARTRVTVVGSRPLTA